MATKTHLVDTVADLTSTTENPKADLIDGQQITVAGYYAAGDNEPRTYVWSAGSTATDNGGTVFEHDAGGDGRFLLVKDAITLRDCGGVGDDSANNYEAIGEAFATGKPVHVGPGIYRVGSPIVMPTGGRIVGAGIDKTIIKSDVIGDSLFKTNGNTTFNTILDMTLLGNGLTGASGNGHAVNFVNPTTPGSFVPQQAYLGRIKVKDFAGLDIRNVAGVDKVSACAVIMHNCLENDIYKVFTQGNGHAFYMDETQSCRITSSVGYQCAKFALLAHKNENLIVDKCNLLAAGDGTPDTGYPATVISLGSSIVVSYENYGFVLSRSKLKNLNAGTALIRSLLSYGDVIEGCWIRPDVLSDIDHNGIYIERGYGIKVRNNVFSPSTTAYAGKKYKMIEVMTTQNTDATTAVIEGNVFLDVSGKDIAANIKVKGNSSARAANVVIRDNEFGGRSSKSGATTVEADILLDTVTLRDSIIGPNKHIAATNVTRTALVKAVTLAQTGTVFGEAFSINNGGTITEKYNGFTPALMHGVELPKTVDVSAGDGNNTIVTGMVYGKRYHIKLEEIEALNGNTSKTFRLGPTAGTDDYMAAVTATGTAVGYAEISGTEHVGGNIVLSWTNNASPSTGKIRATVLVK